MKQVHNNPTARWVVGPKDKSAKILEQYLTIPKKDKKTDQEKIYL